MTNEGRSRVRKALGIGASVIFLAAWIAGGVWYFAFDQTGGDNCAHLAYGPQGDDAAAYDCAHAQDGR
jgi:hypothetical protein